MGFSGGIVPIQNGAVLSAEDSQHDQQKRIDDPLAFLESAEFMEDIVKPGEPEKGFFQLLFGGFASHGALGGALPGMVQFVFQCMDDGMVGDGPDCHQHMIHQMVEEVGLPVRKSRTIDFSAKSHQAGQVLSQPPSGQDADPGSGQRAWGTRARGDDLNLGMQWVRGRGQRRHILIHKRLKVVFDPFNRSAVHAPAHHFNSGCFRSTDAAESAAGAQGTHGGEQRALYDFCRRFETVELRLCIAEALAKEAASIVLHR